MDLVSVLKENRIVPVAVFDDADDACRIVELLLKNSINVVEITLRTEKALESVEAVARRFPDMILGAGSVLSRESLKAAKDRGALFAVSPGLDTGLLGYARDLDFPFVPGIATPSELIAALEFSPIIKIFPAGALGGVDYINAVTAPFKMKELYIMPTGGINGENFTRFLKADRVIACGMSYLVDGALIRQKNFAELERRMAEAVAGLAE